MGRPKKPTALHVLNGNPSKKKSLGEGEPKPPPVIDAPKPPSWLSKHAKKEWKRLAPVLVRVGLLTEADIGSFVMLCQAYGKWEEYERDIQKNGSTYIYINKGGGENEVERPQTKLAHKAYERYKSLCTEFGVTPASRTRIEVKSEEAESDPLERLLSR